MPPATAFSRQSRPLPDARIAELVGPPFPSHVTRAIQGGNVEPTVEQRKHRRHPINFQGIYSSGSAQIKEAVVLDLSMGGCRVSSPIPMPPDTVIELQIRPHQAAPIYVPSAIVRWTRGHACGVQFQGLPKHESKALTRLLFTRGANRLITTLTHQRRLNRSGPFAV